MNSLLVSFHVRTMDYRMSMTTNVMAYCSTASSWPKGCDRSRSARGDASGHDQTTKPTTMATTIGMVLDTPLPITPSMVLYPSAWLPGDIKDSALAALFKTTVKTMLISIIVTKPCEYVGK